MNKVSEEPVLSAAAVSAAIVALASLFDVVLDLTTVQTVVVAVLPLVAAVVARSKVAPV
jgi:hypothetical protein